MVVWSIPARDDLKRIHDYIAQDSKYYARRVIDALIEKAELLLEFPEMGRKVPEIGDAKIREIPIYSYRLMYKYSTHGIEVLTVVHSKQIFSGL